LMRRVGLWRRWLRLFRWLLFRYGPKGEWFEPVGCTWLTVNVPCDMFLVRHQLLTRASCAFARSLVLLQASLVYYAAAVFLHYIVPFFLRNNLTSVQKGRRAENQVRREAIVSLGPLFVKSVLWSVVDWLVVARKMNWWWSPWVTVYDDGEIHFWGVVGTVIVLDLLHDAWFYWTHRLLHTKGLYRRVHYMHHESRYVILIRSSWHDLSGVWIASFLRFLLLPFQGSRECHKPPLAGCRPPSRDIAFTSWRRSSCFSTRLLSASSCRSTHGYVLFAH
jgi:hypothetical protein